MSICYTWAFSTINKNDPVRLWLWKPCVNKQPAGWLSAASQEECVCLKENACLPAGCEGFESKRRSASFADLHVEWRQERVAGGPMTTVVDAAKTATSSQDGCSSARPTQT